MKKLFPWFGVVALLIVIFGTIYAVAQQAQRHEANYPQIQLAEDTAASLNSGTSPNALFQANINVNTSLAPFVVVYDKSGTALASSGLLNGKLPVAPLGILRAAAFSEFHAITWQPQDNLRIAAVTVVADNYYVLSGRSLKEVEKNETRSFELSFVSGLFSLLVLKVIYVFSGQYRSKTKHD